jgi:hypothetical protein
MRWTNKDVGLCIYCAGLGRPHEGALSKEHVVALGLGGQLALYRASCERCASVTSAIEGRALHEMFQSVRSSLRLPTRRPKKRRMKFLLDGSDDAGSKSVNLPVDQFPATASFVEFGVPWLLRGETKKGIAVVGTRLVQLGGPSLSDVGKAHGFQEVRVTHKSSPMVFARMLGKVGYCYAVGMLGLAGLQEALVLPAIFDCPDEIGQWVGASNMDDISVTLPPSAHVLRLAMWRDMVVVQIKLFAMAPTPAYMVVVGRWSPDAVKELEADFA